MSEKQRLNREEIKELASNALMASGALETSAKSLAKTLSVDECQYPSPTYPLWIPKYIF